MSLEAVLARPTNVRDLILPDRSKTRIDPRNLATADLRRQVDSEILSDNLDRAKTALAYQIVFGEDYKKDPDSSYFSSRYENSQQLMLFAYLILSDNPDKKGIPRLFEQTFRPQRLHLTSIIRSDASFYYQIVFGRDNLPEVYNLLFNQVESDYRDEAENVKRDSFKKVQTERLYYLRTFAIARLAYGNEFDNSGLWQSIRSEMLVGINEPKSEQPTERLRSLAFATILEADRVTIDSDKKLHLNFDSTSPTVSSPLPDQRRFS